MLSENFGMKSKRNLVEIDVNIPKGLYIWNTP